MKNLLTATSIASCVALVALASGCGETGTQQSTSGSDGGSPPAVETVTLQVSNVFASSLVLLGDSAFTFAEKVNRVSGGTLELKVFEPGALVPSLEAIPAVSKGSVEAAWSTPGYFAGTDLTFSIFTTVPFGPDAPEFLAWMYYGGGLELADEMFAEHNVKAIPCGIIPPEASGWFREEITSLDDLKGMKIRFFGLGARVLDKMGAATQLLAPGDVFPALQLGTVDATEFAMPAIDESVGFYQVAKHYYFPGWHQPASILDLFVNLDVWNGLSDHHQAVLEVTCGDMVKSILARGEALQAPAMRRMRDDHGVNIHYWPDEFLQAYEKAWNEVVEEESQNNENFKRVYASFAEFRENFKLWGENGYLKR